MIEVVGVMKNVCTSIDKVIYNIATNTTTNTTTHNNYNTLIIINSKNSNTSSIILHDNDVK